MTVVSRRRLLASGTAAGLLATAGIPALAGAKRGGTLRLALQGAHPTDRWDARTHDDLFMRVMGQGCVFDCLTEIAASGELVGELAVSWESSAEATLWTFDLRKGVTFHNGQPFGADDVISSFQLHEGPGSRSLARPIVDEIIEMRKLGNHQVQFRLRSPNVDFPLLVADHRLLIYPAGQFGTAFAEGIGTGLYRTVLFEPGKRAIAKRVDGHYKDGRAGWFDVIDAVAVHDPEARLDALRSGRADAINAVQPAEANRLRRNPRLRLLETAGNQHIVLTPQSADSEVLQALRHGIDRRRLSDVGFGGTGSMGVDAPVGPRNQF
ncbi:MAG: ABC transporter substrate-binding protein, partial [Pseudomonadota bacterium]